MHFLANGKSAHACSSRNGAPTASFTLANETLETAFSTDTHMAHLLTLARVAFLIEAIYRLSSIVDMDPSESIIIYSGPRDSNDTLTSRFAKCSWKFDSFGETQTGLADMPWYNVSPRKLWRGEHRITKLSLGERFGLHCAAGLIRLMSDAILISRTMAANGYARQDLPEGLPRGTPAVGIDPYPGQVNMMPKERPLAREHTTAARLLRFRLFAEKHMMFRACPLSPGARPISERLPLPPWLGPTKENTERTGTGYLVSTITTCPVCWLGHDIEACFSW